MIDVSNFVKTLSNKPVAVFGLGRSGLSTIKALSAAGANVIAWDDNEAARAAAAVAANITIEELTPPSFASCKILILAPGIPLHYPEPHPVVKAARDAGLEIICDIELLYRCNHGRKTIGVTGTNGKSTATALIAHILNEAGIEAAAAGNIGTPVLDTDLPGKDGVLVIELSSFQLDLCPTFRPDIGVMLNITPDHIDRHGSFKNYKASKMRMLDGAGMSIVEGDTIEAAKKAARAMGVADGVIEEAIQSFKPLPHRQQFVRRIGNVDYINDSKATNAESCIYALKNFDDIYLIAGGLAKEGGLEGIQNYKDKIRQVFLIGAAAAPFAEWCDKKNLHYVKLNALEQAVQAAYEASQEAGSGTVLLSPACASYDQFSSFEERGTRFMELVEKL